LPDIGPVDLARLVEVLGKYRDQEIGVADASIILLAARYGTRSLLALDHRRFGVLPPIQGGRSIPPPSSDRAMRRCSTRCGGHVASPGQAHKIDCLARSSSGA
jgi:hypothetical protein